jgi:hypothetical protein
VYSSWRAGREALGTVRVGVDWIDAGGQLKIRKLSAPCFAFPGESRP